MMLSQALVGLLMSLSPSSMERWNVGEMMTLGLDVLRLLTGVLQARNFPFYPCQDSRALTHRDHSLSLFWSLEWLCLQRVCMCVWPVVSWAILSLATPWRRKRSGQISSARTPAKRIAAYFALKSKTRQTVAQACNFEPFVAVDIGQNVLLVSSRLN